MFVRRPRRKLIAHMACWCFFFRICKRTTWCLISRDLQMRLASRHLGYIQVSRNLFQNKGGFGKSGFLKILIKIRVPGPKSAHFLRPPARGHGLAADCSSVGFASPETTGRTRSRSGIASRQCSPVADGRLHSPETPLCCCLARAQAFFFTVSIHRVDALESQVQFCWQEAHG